MSEVASLLHSPTAELVLRALDASALRHAVHAGNIANATVEGYQPLKVSFEEHLAAARGALLSRDDGVARRAVDTLQAQVTPATDGRPLEIDRETALMMENAVRYQALLTALGKNGALLKLAIREGRN